MTVEQQLTSLGFKDNEILVFLAVLELGEPTVGGVEQETGLHKQIIYNVAEGLRRKGLLVIVEIRGRKRFRVNSPAVLEEFAEERLRQAKSVVPQLIQRANKKVMPDRIRTYRGRRNVQHYYVESIRQQPGDSNIYILGIDSDRYFEIMNPESSSYRRFEDIRVRRNIQISLLLFGAEGREAELNKGRPHIELRLLEKAVRGPMDIMIWHGHVGMLFYENEPYVLDIEGQDTVKGFHEYFRVLWEEAHLIRTM